MKSRLQSSPSTHSKLGFDPDSVKRPIGVFDSGIGGLSVLQALRAELPHEDFVYVADNAHAPYGERDDAYVLARARLITAELLARHHIQALVIACNTATAAAIGWLRQAHPTLAIIGVEPALKPALAQSRTQRIGVMATRTTLGSAKFRALLDSLARQADFICQPCDGLADAIERDDTTKIIALCSDYTGAIGKFGKTYGQIDTLVLGCTHYPFASAHLLELLGPEVQLIDNGGAVARQARRLLQTASSRATAGRCVLLTTGDPRTLRNGAQRWLGHDGQVDLLSI